jgi:outer membrane protein assembly factor BamB
MNFSKHRFFSSYAIYIFMIGILIVSQTIAADWPQWRGPERNGASQENNLLKSWPDDGPELIWSKEELGKGFSSVSIANGRLYITGIIDDQEMLTALDLDGNIQWQTKYGPIWDDSYSEARTTPTVDGEQVFVISGMGKVVCIDVFSGQIKWSVDSIDDFDGEIHRYGIAESPLVFDNKIICSPGGRNASVVALDKNSGELIWQSKTLSETANYCSPILINKGDKKIIATQLAESFVGLDAADGSVLWQDKYEEYQDDPKDLNINSPLYHDGSVYVTSGYDNASAMYKLSDDGTKINRKWVNQTLDVHIGGIVRVDNYIYGANWEDNKNGNWVCLDWNTGKVMYEEKWNTKGSIIYADGMLYCYEEKRGNLALVKSTPKKFEKISSFKIPLGSGPHWGHPSISDGRLYVRHGDALMVYDIKSKM